MLDKTYGHVGSNQIHCDDERCSKKIFVYICI